MYYKAEIIITTAQLYLNPETNEYEGCDPDTFQDHGVTQTIVKPSLAEIKAEIETQFFNIKDQGELFDGCLEFQYDGEYHYNTPKEDQIPFLETARIIVSQVEETTLDAAKVFTELN